MTSVPLAVAFAAGIVSFLSPCVLPLIPGYVAYLAAGAAGIFRRREIFLNSLAFTAGFSLVFAFLGVFLNTILEAVAYDALIWLSRAGGIIIIFFGLYLMGVVKAGFLERQWHIRVRLGGTSYLASILFGAAFAAGWTPCIGAVLGAILGLAASSPGIAFGLLLAYALGFSIPFLLVGLFTDQATRLIAKFGGWAVVINRLFGLCLVVLGVLIFTQRLSRLANFWWLSMWFGN
ncbi:MAG: cytochrome C biogenesis protein [Candidatus Andersenbacteria bacterium]|nr:cytochrome C biogenesis protein [Candidatus Andersenbacteria bacterium]